MAAGRAIGCFCSILRASRRAGHRERACVSSANARCRTLFGAHYSGDDGDARAQDGLIALHESIAKERTEVRWSSCRRKRGNWSGFRMCAASAELSVGRRLELRGCLCEIEQHRERSDAGLDEAVLEMEVARLLINRVAKHHSGSNDLRSLNASENRVR